MNINSNFIFGFIFCNIPCIHLHVMNTDGTLLTYHPNVPLYHTCNEYRWYVGISAVKFQILGCSRELQILKLLFSITSNVLIIF